MEMEQKYDMIHDNAFQAFNKLVDTKEKQDEYQKFVDDVASELTRFYSEAEMFTMKVNTMMVQRALLKMFYAGKI